MPALFIFAVSLLHWVAYTEAALILLLLLAIVFVLFQGVLWMRNCQRAEAEREEARRTLDTLRRMSEIRVETVTRLRGFTG
jgi:uncharacterized membrane protein affecting hemolysin expression